MKKTIKFIGFGEVVKRFLTNHPILIGKFNVEVYSKSNVADGTSFNGVVFRDISEFQSTNDVVVVSASINERELLSRCSSHSRKEVAQSNIKIIKKLAEKYLFSKGFIFVLTNPVEAISEFIYFKSRNKNIYALGAFNDILRFKKITENIYSNIKCLEMLGFHYLNPVPRLFFKDELDKNLSLEEIDKMDFAYSKKVKTEFNGFKPPVNGGIQNLMHLCQSLIGNKIISVSGFNKYYNCFLIGKLDLSNYNFVTNKPVTKAELISFKKKIKIHKLLCQDLGV